MNRPNIQKAVITKTANQTQIQIPSFKNKSLLMIMLIFLCFWIYLSKTVVFEAFGLNNKTANGIDAFSIYFFIAWLIGTLLVVGLMSWSLLGKEKIIINDSQIELSKKILGIGINSRFNKDEIKNITFNKVDTNIDLLNRNKLSLWGLGKGKIQFELSKKKYSFGLALEDLDANELIKFMKIEIK